MLALGIHYLTGYATATDTGSRELAEWPPHPARVFMALVAAHYEGHMVSAIDHASERAALEWLEALPAPALKVSDADSRQIVTHYVPVNDKVSPPDKPNRQPRTFPKIRPQDPNVFLVWASASNDDVKTHGPALARLCEKATRIGHSSSLVQLWLVEQGKEPSPDLFSLTENVGDISVNPRSKRGVLHLRIATTGTLRYLDEQFNRDDIEVFFDIKKHIAAAKGKQKNDLKTQFQEYFGMPFSSSMLPPNRAWPTLALTCAYTREKPIDVTADSTSIAVSPFDSDLLVFAKLDGPVLGLESTAWLTKALRGAILKTCVPDGNAPEWLCGHSANGAAATKPHLALAPLAFVGHEHADGHLLGMALAIPREVSHRERAKFLRPLLFATGEDGLPVSAIITLTLGPLGSWTLTQEERTQPPVALRAETWCRRSTTWTTVTPVVLDRHPKTKKPAARLDEIVKLIADSCEHSGLPRPVEIDVDRTSWHVGAPSSAPGQSGFPMLIAQRQQFHVWLRFPVPIEGPIFIGAGRYRGYGFFKPFY